MSYGDISPMDINPDTGRPYPGYSSPSLDTGFHDHEMDVDEEEEPQERDTRGPYFVSVFLIDRAHGGPEEGGWWYDCGELVRTCRLFKSSGQAYDFCRRMNDKLAKTLNKGRRPISSVASDGIFEARVDHARVPNRFPESRPHYE